MPKWTFPFQFSGCGICGNSCRIWKFRSAVAFRATVKAHDPVVTDVQANGSRGVGSCKEEGHGRAVAVRSLLSVRGVSGRLSWGGMEVA